MAAGSARWIYLSLGWGSVALAVIGIPLPLLPTTPFLLLAAFCFARGSDRLHRWLLNHEHLGPPIQRWREYRAISREAKWMGTISLLLLVAASYWLGVQPWLLALQGGILVAVGGFLWTRPEPPRKA